MKLFTADKNYFDEKVKYYPLPTEPSRLFDPVKYLLSLGGKRIRPLLSLASCNAFGGDRDIAIHPAMAVEVFHNFSLMHDDIMDDADLRRGQDTVHQKYDVNTAILSGDVMLIYAYKILMQLPAEFHSPCITVFNKMAEEVCIGQQMDMDFEESVEVAIMDYLKMIELKTSVLLGASLQLGAIIANANEKNGNHLYQFGKNIGIAFQIQDDILDTYGEQAAVGKMIGGDILNNKKTYLYLKACQLLSEESSVELRNLYSSKDAEPQPKIDRVKQLFKDAGVKIYAEELKGEYKNLALSHLDMVEGINSDAKSQFANFADYLIQRSV